MANNFPFKACYVPEPGWVWCPDNLVATALTMFEKAACADDAEVVITHNFIIAKKALERGALVIWITFYHTGAQALKLSAAYRQFCPISPKDCDQHLYGTLLSMAHDRRRGFHLRQPKRPDH